MANALYDKYREDALSRNAGTSSPIDIDTDTISLALVKAAYTVNLATDQYISTPAAQIPSASWRSGASGVTGVSVTAGVFNHSAKTLTAVASDSGNAATRIVYYKYNATDASAPLIAYIDTFTPGNSVTPNGGDITVTPDTGANKVFKI
jgi:hypothetical protein